ncbi:DNA-3-methyladenine glycosylase 2 family protein [Crossiella sp. CA-258035]|uniref:DNA-3-methyladenine glycosylase family protein n=1 Tax=Crossiella sp. CA-258035 TaxID=2981138 RepID=UPI0024BC3EF9|nr:DNA-3-methyladenine glycosylase 2 family protein [Crossiella sp. CA-258035]WHT20384.1 DNA-3-methyladenine glycosylase 2 family protein [Crossiella sp. CA-258035]
MTLAAPAAERAWTPPFALDLAAVLKPLRRGPADPCLRIGQDGTAWRASNTPAGPATLALRRSGGEIRASAWGPGADLALAALPDLLGAGDDDTGFVAHHPLIAESRRRAPGLRIGRTGQVWDVLIPAVLEQKVTGKEAWRSWRELCRRFGTVAPGPALPGSPISGPALPGTPEPEPVPPGAPLAPAAAPLYTPPTPRALLAIPDWEWHRAGVDGARRRTLLAAASVATRLERAVDLGGEAGRELLRKVPGIGVWTAAEVAQRAWGDPDAVSVGDFHLHDVVGWALAGRKASDEEMLEILAPYAPQRQRAIRYLECSGARKPRFGPRFAGRDYRAI